MEYTICQKQNSINLQQSKTKYKLAEQKNNNLLNTAKQKINFHINLLFLAKQKYKKFAK
jgi:hypothetical protein